MRAPRCSLVCVEAPNVLAMEKFWNLLVFFGSAQIGLGTEDEL